MLVEHAAEIVARWNDLQGVQPHELRAHTVITGLCRAMFKAIRTDEDWFTTGSFRVPWLQEPLMVALLVGRVGEDVRAVLREGRPVNILRHYPPAVLRKSLEKSEQGPLESWRLWINVYFLNGIRDALFGLRSDEEGAAWKAAAAFPGAGAVVAARVAIESAFHLIPMFEPALPALLSSPEKMLEGASRRSVLIWKRAGQLDVHVAPQNVPLEIFGDRNPPEGMGRKEWALNPTQQMIWYLMAKQGMSRLEVARILAMDDPRQVRDAYKEALRKRAAWARFRVR